MRNKIHHASRFILAGILLWAGMLKLNAIEELITVIGTYQILNPTLSVAFGTVLPLLEIGGAALLLYPKTTPIGAVLALGLFVVFSIALGWAIHRGTPIECGCFSKYGGPPTMEKMWFALIRDIGLIGLAILTLATRPRQK